MQTSSEDKVLSVSELTANIKSILETHFQFIFLKGEISNFKLQSSGHMYFSLKDSFAQISAVLFQGNAKNLTQLPKDGDQVIVEANLSVYPPRGNYQLIIRKISFLGVGDLLAKLHQLKEKLKNLGWFDSSLKKSLPILPKTIGIVTSPTGAVIQDILNVLKRRFTNFNLILNPVKVQGQGAAEEIAQAIYDFNKYNLADVLIIGRGGGSLEDLWAFNEEIVAKAIFESKIPIISAVGHETDVSIADFVADVRAPTPSAAAEIVIKEKMQLLDTLKTYEKQLSNQLLFQIKHIKATLNKYLSHPLFSSSYALLGNKIQLLDEFKNSLQTAIKYKLNSQKNLLQLIESQIKSLNPKNQIKEFKNRLNLLSQRIDFRIQSIINFKKERLTQLISHLNTIDPKNLLKKGYSILFSEKEASIILSKDTLSIGDSFKAIVSDGEIKATVKDKT